MIHTHISEIENDMKTSSGEEEGGIVLRANLSGLRMKVGEGVFSAGVRCNENSGRALPSSWFNRILASGAH